MASPFRWNFDIFSIIFEGIKEMTGQAVSFLPMVEMVISSNSFFIGLPVLHELLHGESTFYVFVIIFWSSHHNSNRNLPSITFLWCSSELLGKVLLRNSMHSITMRAAFQILHISLSLTTSWIHGHRSICRRKGLLWFG